MFAGRNQTIGTWGEKQACLFLTRHGFTVVDRNFYTTQGEIDVVAKKGGDFYFVEVKTRQEGDFATDLAITPAKRHKLAKTIKSYCFRHNIQDSGLVTAGLLVIINSFTKRVAFRFAVIY